jgi:hypothetical protein
MKKLLNEILFGKNSMLGGIIALAVISAISLGCFCNKDKFGNLANSTTPSATATPSPSPSPTKSITKSDPSKNQVPGDDEMQEIVKKTLLDFNDSLQSEDFTSFYNSISKYWQKQTSPEKLKASFQRFIDKNADLSPIRSMTAKFTRGPEITKSLGMKTLEVEGEYPTTPITSTFDLKYIVEGKEWKLVGINVRTRIDP